MITNDRVQEVNSRLLKISPGWQGGARAGYKSTKGVVASLSMVAGINRRCCCIFFVEADNTILQIHLINEFELVVFSLMSP